MAGWPSNWRELTLRAAGIPKTQFALDILSQWRQSTPVDPHTNNPLGMPAKGNHVPRVLNTAYAAFPTMQAFYAAFKRFMHANSGKALLHELISAQSQTATWREIHALNWPANATEKDHPVAVLDKVTEKYRATVTARPRGTTVTTGITHAAPDVHEAVQLQAAVLYKAATSFDKVSDAIAHIVEGLN